MPTFRDAPLSPARLAQALAARLAPVVPPPFGVRADDDHFVIDHPEGWGATVLVSFIMAPDAASGVDYSCRETGPRTAPTAAEQAETAVGAVLNSLQDAVPEATREPWPEVAPRRMAPYGTRCDGAALYFWYGSTEAAPVVAFAPIPLRNLEAPA